ncbi:YxeA family protein [Fredinandcohnia quinoae]|uniref:YxeA family protein n=1 Tax=Fredinandcohnia quinoae TaxID=2918902 RepID=A0AAW5EDE0_9BACI|nr:YxeA family protein [Fredinandcohnia sp. SECRCQ15]MCH1627461.1 YxeA family protein [Fredinandcohnia sp. SECRCQ15]
MKKWVIIITCIVILGIGGSVYLENTTSGLKPTIEGLFESEYKPHYVKTESDNYKKLWNGKYRYTFTGYAEDGQKQEIVRVIDRELRSDAYLRMYAEGSLGKFWEEVQKDEIPEKALSKLK